MEKFEFKSQICTTREQSERLLAIGLKKETADMMYITDGRVPEEYRHYDIVTECYESCLEDIVYIPAWSLHRLIELCGGIVYDWMSKGNNPYEDAINCLELLIKNDCYNKDYLEDKQ